MLNNLICKLYFKSTEIRNRSLKTLKSNKGITLIEYITIGVLILIIIIGIIAAFKEPLKAIADRIVGMLTGASTDTY